MNDRDQRIMTSGIRAENLIKAGISELIAEKIDKLTSELLTSGVGEQNGREVLYLQIRVLDTLLTEVSNNHKTYQHLMGGRSK